jgi:hydroxyacylglutathione hydrolase
MALFARRRYGKDNYVYLIAEGGDAALVDPGHAATALALARDHRVQPRFILHTHGHHDHVGGSAEVKAALGATVHGHAGDRSYFPPDVEVGAPALRLGALSLRVHHTPGHTAGSVLYEWDGRLLTGDTLFWGGSGNCRYGDPHVLARSFLEVISRLDPALEVHPGHEYVEQNLPFDLELDPGNPVAEARLAACRAALAAGEEPPPSRLADELRSNPFLRAGEPAMSAALARRGVSAATREEAFVALRGLKDRWHPPAR